MTAVTNHYSLKLPALTWEGIIEIQEPDWKTLARQVQLVAIALLLGGACALSAAGFLPATVLVSCSLGVMDIFATVFLVLPACDALNIKDNEEKLCEHEMEQFRKMAFYPLVVCVICPLIEEFAFRSILQRGLCAGLSYIVPAIVITIVGLEFSVAAVISIVATGIIFGLAHRTNHPDDPFKAILHSVVASVSGVFIYGPLHYAFGIWGSTLAHIVNNTISVGSGEIVDAYKATPIETRS